MRKVSFITLIILLSLSLINKNHAYAQGTFDCSWKQRGAGGQWYCGVEVNCESGFQSDQAVCDQFSNEASCNTSINNSCVIQGPDEQLCSNVNCPPGTSYLPIFKKCCEGAGNNCKTPINADCPNGYIFQTQGLECHCVKNNVIDKQISIIKPEECECKGIISQECVDQGNTPAECTRQVCGIRTMIGCVPTDPGSIPGWLFTLSLPIAGAAAFALMLYGAFLILTSSGNPDRLKEGQEILFSALAGLLLIIFSVFTMRLVGVTILKIPGFG